ncbi:hypothetical protein GCM10025771_11620 [Niveibacterium umoris]|uniref:Permuted papain-like amidase enzyme, YaeF/YiiX, C92 family n=1 Tax=Niveibacterium umoris TaxID=1193620 RepID=A0A840BJ70_9RHOO|nr:hypothetical protein [Niveibacterium umoris]MBB4013285.1 hypothetical protein [Niveibacterium umoris]
MTASAIPLSAVRPGDVLLHGGVGPLSDLIAWASNSIYSHAAMALDADTMIEAGATGVITRPMSTRLTDTAHYTLIDVYRFGPPGAGLNAAQLAALEAKARAFLGTPYPLDKLFELGVVCAVRSQLDWPEPLRWLLRVALDHVVESDPNQMVCSEFVYRSYAEADTQPAGALRPVIEVVEQKPAPFPHIDWIALIEEYEDARHHSVNRALPAAPSAPRAVGTAGPTAADPHIAAQAALIRARRARPATRSLAVKEIIDPFPNTATVSPQDFAASPSFSLLGRVLPST